MRNLIYIFILLIGLSNTSCFQNLGQNPPFDYPEQPTPPPLGKDGQIFYLSFDENYEEFQSLTEAIKIGTPDLVEGKKGKAYLGAENSYLTFPLENMAAPLSTEITFSFWYKLNNNPDRAGILVIGPPTKAQSENKQNNRTSGIRLFRENANGKQRIKANIGNGTFDHWLDGGANADIDPNDKQWHYISLVLKENEALLYIDDKKAASTKIKKVSWKNCDIMSIGSGSPRFNEWGHLSDHSIIDELRIFNKPLNENEIKNLINK